MMKAAKSVPWPFGITKYIRELEEWESEGNLKGIKVNVS
jgi:hypothetical protein